MGQRSRFQVQNGHGAFSNLYRAGYGVPDAPVVSRFRLEPVNYKFYEVNLVSVQSVYFLQGLDFSVYAHLCIATAAKLIKQFPVMALSASDKRRKQVAFAAGILCHNEVDYLLIRVTDHLLAAFGGYGT